MFRPSFLSIAAWRVAPEVDVSGSRGVLRALRRSVLWIVGALAGIASTVVVLSRTTAETSAWVSHSQQVTRLAQRALRLSIDRETGLRGFLLTGREESLAPAIAARAELPLLRDSLLALTADNPVQQERVRAGSDALARWDRDFATPSERAMRAGQPVAMLPLAGKALFDDVRAPYEALLAAERQLYEVRRQRDERVERIALLAVLAELLVLLAVFVHLGMRLSAQTRRLLEQQTLLEDQATELEEQAAELELQMEEAQALAEQLEASNQELLGAATETARARDALAAEREFLHAALESMTDGIVACDAEARLTVFNRAARELLATTPLAVPAEQWSAHYALFCADGVTPLAPEQIPLARALRGERVRDAEIVIRPAGTEARNVLINGQPMLGAQGQLLGAVVAMQNVTARRGLESQLRQAQKMEAVGRLAGGVAHDFNNLLTVITSYAGFLLKELEPASPRRADVQEIRDAAERAANLTRQLLAFSRQQVLAPSHLDLTDVVRGVEGMLTRLLGADVHLRTELTGDVASCFADPGQLEQVVMNLAVNARDAMPDGGQLTIEVTNVTVDAALASKRDGLTPGAYVLLAVSDTGVGMDDATQAQIFEPFFTTKELGSGTGLGLSTVYGIVKQSGGAVTVYSVPGAGTTFKVYLPAHARDARRGAGSGVTHQQSAPGGSDSPPATGVVLVVDDDSAVRAVVRRTLAHRGYSVLESGNGAEALGILADRRQPVDLVVSDVTMPLLGGVQLLQQLSVVRPGTRALLMSGFTADALVRRGTLPAGVAFLSKPFTEEALVAAVAATLEGAALHRRTPVRPIPSMSGEGGGRSARPPRRPQR